MAKRWSFEEDYIVGKFCYEHKNQFIENEVLDELITELEKAGYNFRSKGAVQKRAREYQYLLYNEEILGISKQVKEISRVIVNKEKDREWYMWVNAFASEHADEEQTNAPKWLFEKPSDLINLEPLPLTEFGATFKELLYAFMDERNMIEPQVYSAAHVDRSTFTRIKKGMPVSKQTAMALCFGLRLTLEESRELLVSAGFEFCYNLGDRIIAAYLKQQNYDIVKANIQLYEAQQPILFKH